MSTMEIITQILTAFLGSLGFSVLFNLRRTKLLIAALGGKDSTVDLAEVYKKRLRLIGSTLRSRSDEEKHEILTHIRKEILPYIVQGKFKPKLYAVLPLSDADGAHKIVEANQNIGKVILRVCE